MPPILLNKSIIHQTLEMFKTKDVGECRKLTCMLKNAGGGTMNNSDELKEALCALLNERLSPREAQSLKDEGFKLKKPTRKAAVVISLYKKAASGDLSAIKEMRSILGEKIAESGQRTVTIIDDITT